MKRYLISGGGTGGHIFPAVSIANALKRKQPDCEILFVGAEGRMEMERVPAAGYKIVGLPIAGFDRTRLWRNVAVLWKLCKSLLKARKIVKDFRPDVAVGVGGYASGAALKAANQAGVPTVLQEQNSFAGVTNKLLAKQAEVICVAYKGMERFFPAEKILLTGNPIRQELLKVSPRASEAYEYFNFTPEKKTLLIIGGSLGARTINQSIAAGLKQLKDASIQVIWQTGKTYYEQAKSEADASENDLLLATAFISRMDYAYAIADVVISRAGASSISELCLLGKPSILVPSPNVAEDHQTHNAMALVNQQAALLVKDVEAPQRLVDVALDLIQDENHLDNLATNILKLAEKDSADRIADEVIALAERS